MPEPVAVVPTPRPTGNATQQPAPVAQTQTPPPMSGETDIAAKYKATEAELNKRTKSHVIERRQWERERETLKQQAARAAELEKREAHAKTNPSAYLKSLYGENWQQLVSEAGLTGSTPAQLVQESMDALRAEFEAKEKAREESANKARTSAIEQERQETRRSVFADAVATYRAKASEYPVLAKFGGEPAVGRAIVATMERAFNESHKTDEEGNVLEHGKIISAQQAMEMLEEEILGLTSEALKHEKYKAKLQPSSTSNTVAKSMAQQGSPEKQPAARRSITNDITGSTSATKPPSSEKERRQRVLAAFEAARRKG